MFVNRGLAGPKGALKKRPSKGKQVNSPAPGGSLLNVRRIGLDRATICQFVQVPNPMECRNGEKWENVRVGASLGLFFDQLPGARENDVEVSPLVRT